MSILAGMENLSLLTDPDHLSQLSNKSQPLAPEWLLIWFQFDILNLYQESKKKKKEKKDKVSLPRK